MLDRLMRGVLDERFFSGQNWIYGIVGESDRSRLNLSANRIQIIGSIRPQGLAIPRSIDPIT